MIWTARPGAAGWPVFAGASQGPLERRPRYAGRVTATARRIPGASCVYDGDDHSGGLRLYEVPIEADDRLMIGPTFRPGSPTGRNLSLTTERIPLTLCAAHADELGATPA